MYNQQNHDRAVYDQQNHDRAARDREEMYDQQRQFDACFASPRAPPQPNFAQQLPSSNTRSPGTTRTRRDYTTRSSPGTTQNLQQEQEQQQEQQQYGQQQQHGQGQYGHSQYRQ
ncbi:hypothetical protein T492DRAFT_872937 [Pavlovales sp. CCMP2436]|nr:hypothetical protein T492DRAFT_872937 [Pavlovales sp. CCMP2436]